MKNLLCQAFLKLKGGEREKRENEDGGKKMKKYHRRCEEIIKTHLHKVGEKSKTSHEASRSSTKV